MRFESLSLGGAPFRLSRTRKLTHRDGTIQYVALSNAFLHLPTHKHLRVWGSVSRNHAVLPWVILLHNCVAIVAVVFRRTDGTDEEKVLLVSNHSNLLVGFDSLSYLHGACLLMMILKVPFGCASIFQN